MAVVTIIITVHVFLIEKKAGNLLKVIVEEIRRKNLFIYDSSP